MAAQHQQQDVPNRLLRNNGTVPDNLENKIIHHYGISERRRTIEQCTEENNFPIGFEVRTSTSILIQGQEMC
ncbi:unnamed protein product [Porites lobata]|uniref:Uncharacterized protein n=1 Tax=Porites lobata TaxID=104759 RepID=A0ABN8QVK0_9CNID|nr:unnamed protein product [Porites lobata]